MSEIKIYSKNQIKVPKGERTCKEEEQWEGSKYGGS